MAIGDARFSFLQADAAEHQLNRAIALFIDERDFVCAITLASAADGIFGETLEAQTQDRSIDDHVTNLRPNAPTLSEKQIRDEHLNLARNILKHKRVPRHQPVTLALETEAIYMITRALDNAVRLGYELTDDRNRFVEWVYLHRKDLISDVVPAA